MTETNFQPFLRTKRKGAQRAYLPRLRAFDRDLRAHGKDIPTADQGDFLEHTEGLASETASLALTATRGYLKFLKVESPLLDEEFRIRKDAPKELTYIDEENYTQILAGQDGSPKGVRNRALIMVLFDSGARIAELSKIELCDLDLKRGSVRRPIKGGGYHTTPLTEATIANLGLWLMIRNRLANGTDALFIATGGRTPGAGLTVEGAKWIVKDAVRSVGVKASPHSFRRGLAIWLDAQGMSRARIIRHMGWRDGRMLDLYLRHLKDDEEIRDHLPGNLLQVGQSQPTSEADQRSEVDDDQEGFGLAA